MRDRNFIAPLLIVTGGRLSKGDSAPSRFNMNREMVAEQCPAQLPALTASTHSELYKKDARLADRRGLRAARRSAEAALQPLIH
ncbi:hypothetical protein CBI35_12210 [Pantoea sp. AV62]|nr:hypothetical protein HA39_09450 [Pantoea brenneri]OXM23882.1 hypothetical protein CBI35_12210 [Pantoea sp. AV62]HAI06349.1 hypothetical protein [Pantoea sp.]